MSPAESPTVATYPSAGGWGEIHGCVFKKKMHGSRHQGLFKENIRKTKKGVCKF